VEQSSQGSFVPKDRDDILIVAIGTEEHPGRVRTTGFGVRQYFESVSRPSFFANVSQQMMDQLTTQLKERLIGQMTKSIKEQVTQELRVEFEQRYNPAEPVDVIYVHGRAITKGSCDVEDYEDDDTESFYQCKLFVDGNHPRVVAICRMYLGGSTIHTLPMQSDLSRVVVEKVKDAFVVIPVPTLGVNTVGEALGTFIAWPTNLIKTISKNYQVYFIKRY